MSIRATDGEIGEVYDFFFDDETWTIRYLVVDTGKWFSGRRVLISPVVLGKPDRENEVFPVSLTRQQVQKSPDIDVDRPISRLSEQQLYTYYGWPSYWSGIGPFAAENRIPFEGGVGQVTEEETGKALIEQEHGDIHIRSTREVIGYHIQASDGEIGHVQDFIIDDENLEMRFMVVDTRNWWPGKEVLVAPQWVESVNWEDEKVHVDLTCESIRSSPEYENLPSINRDYEEKLYNYYKRRRYWR